MRNLLWASFLGVVVLGVACGESPSPHVRVLAVHQAAVDAWGEAEVERFENGGFSFVRARTSGEGRPSLIRGEWLDTPLDLTRSFLRLWLRVDRLDRLSGFEVRLSSGDLSGAHFAYDIPLYSDPEFNLIQPGAWTPITVAWSDVRSVGSPDPQAVASIGLFVADDATGSVSVDWGGVEAVDRPDRGFVSFTFDDGYEEHATFAAPALAKHGFSGTAYVMPDQVGRAGFVSEAHLHALADEFGWDVAAHHADPFTGRPASQLEDTILGIQRYLGSRKLGRGYRHLAFPLGKHDHGTVLPLVRKHFATARIASGGFETLPPADPHRLRVLNVTNTTTPEELGDAARRAHANREWLILMFHHFVEEAEGPIDYSRSEFVLGLQAIADSGVEVRTVSEVWKSQRGVSPIASFF